MVCVLTEHKKFRSVRIQTEGLQPLLKDIPLCAILHSIAFILLLVHQKIIFLQKSK